MKKITFITLFVGLMLLLSGCRMGIRGSGHVVTETRDVSGFDQVVLAGIGEVILTQGDEESLEIEAEDNLMQYLETTVRGDTLTIGIDDRSWMQSINPTKPIKFTLTMKDIRGVKLAGSGAISAQSLETDKLELQLSGSGDITVESVTAKSLSTGIYGSGDITVEKLSVSEVSSRITGSGNCSLAGNTSSQELNLLGSGDYNAAELESKTAALTITGSGNGKVWATEDLEANISGSGDVRYYGTPSVNTHITGSGSVNRLER